MRVMVAGMGLMGSALADALLQAGFEVTVWNRTPEKCRPAVEAGARQVATVAEGAADCDLLVSCLADHDAVVDTITSDTVGAALAGKALVQLSQASPEQSRGFADWAAGHDIGFLEGSILAYPKDMREGNCIVIYAGDPALFDRCAGPLDAMGGHPRLVGDKAGVATAFDKAFFAFYYAHAVGLVHGAAICRAAGVPVEAFLKLMIDDWDWTLPDSVTAAALKTGDYTAREGALATHAYAYNQVAPFCRAIGVEPGLADAIDRIIADGIGRGHGMDELASLIEALHPKGR